MFENFGLLRFRSGGSSIKVMRWRNSQIPFDSSFYLCSISYNHNCLLVHTEVQHPSKHKSSMQKITETTQYIHGNSFCFFFFFLNASFWERNTCIIKKLCKQWLRTQIEDVGELFTHAKYCMCGVFV